MQHIAFASLVLIITHNGMRWLLIFPISECGGFPRLGLYSIPSLHVKYSEHHNIQSVWYGWCGVVLDGNTMIGRGCILVPKGFILCWLLGLYSGKRDKRKWVKVYTYSTLHSCILYLQPSQADMHRVSLE